MFIVLSATVALGGAAGLPEIRKQAQLNEETRIWVKAIEKTKASGKPVSVYNDNSQTAQKSLKAIVGPYIPLKRIEYAWIKKNGTFGLKFKKKYRIDIPLKDGNYIRVKMDDQEMVGKLKATKTVKKHIPVQLLVFQEKHAMQIDKLGHNRMSTVPEVGKILGLMPHIVSLAYLEQKGVPYAAPQLDGMGISQNTQSVTDLLHVEDSLPPGDYLPDTH
jgi:hypothetical protein